MSTINPASYYPSNLYQQRSNIPKSSTTSQKMANDNTLSVDTVTIKASKNYTDKPSVDLKKEQENYQKDLESFRTTEDVRTYQSNKLEYFLAEINKVNNNSNLSEEKKDELLNKLTSRLLGIIEENEKFSRSGRFSELRALERQDKIKDLEKKGAAQMKALREQFEAAQESAKAAAKEAEIRAKCLVIASRILSGDDVPKEDYQFLSKHDSELFAMAITYRRQKEDPDRYKRLSEEEEDETKRTCSSEIPKNEELPSELSVSTETPE